MIASIVRLSRRARARLVAHFLALPIADRRLRFGTPVAAAFLARYVDAIDFDRDGVFGIRDARPALVGVAHLAIDGDLAELGVSVLPAQRRRGLATALFARAAAHARHRGVPRLVMRFLAGNAPIMGLARKFGMDIVSDGRDADARLALPPASLTSLAGALVADTREPYERVLDALATRARLAYARHRQREQARDIYEALRVLDDRALRDLGFHRSEILSVAAKATGAAERTRVRALRQSPDAPA